MNNDKECGGNNRMNRITQWREMISQSLGIGFDRKIEIYRDLLQAASLKDPNYWLQILFAAGIATLGLVLNSPAVIIGAMLISPLMGPILAAGLAFTTGDLILGLRSCAVLFMSCLVAVLVATTLVGILPFKEITAEITARTQPTTLDLIVALFSGAVGSVAISRTVKGMVTSIPGVAIAVALMPPLCVVGFGLGISFSLNPDTGFRLSRGGGLLFLTNLVAIIFTAMVVFWVAGLNAWEVKQQASGWHEENPESQLVKRGLARFHLPEGLYGRRSALSRLFMMVVVLSLLLIPLSRSLRQLSREISWRNEENRIRETAVRLWQPYETMANGKARSFLDSVSISASGPKLDILLRVFSSQPYTPTETAAFQKSLAMELQRPIESVNFQLVEIPTSAAVLTLKTKLEPSAAPPPPPTVMQLQAAFWQRTNRVMEVVRWPSSTRLLGFNLILSESSQTLVEVRYLAERELGLDAQELITQDIRSRLEMPAVEVAYQWIPTTLKTIVFKRNLASLNREDEEILRQAKILTQQNARLQLVIVANREPSEPETIVAERGLVVSTFLTQPDETFKNRLALTAGNESSRTVRLSLQIVE